MPFTIFHFALPVFTYAVLQFTKKEWTKTTWLSIFTGSVLPDIQGFFAIMFDPRIPLHGFSHTLIGSLVYTISYV